ncbi:MAG: hypothetical protein U0359_24110 [Byssovorax sp.]
MALSLLVAGCGKGKGKAAGTSASTSKPTGTAVAQVKGKEKEKEKEKEKKDPNAPPRPPAKHGSFPNNADGVKALISQFIAPGADVQALARTLQPDLEDYDVVFTPDVAGKLRHEYEELWEEGEEKVDIPAGRTETKVWKATLDELLAGKGENQACVDAYKGMAKMLKPGTVVYCFKYYKPGELVGTAFDGLIYVRDHWAIFPKAEKVLQHVEEEEEEEAREKAEKEAKDKGAPKK